MDKKLQWIKNHFRTVVQILFAAVTNGYAAGFLEGKIYGETGSGFVCRD